MRQKDLLALGIFNSRSRLGNRIELLLHRGRMFSPKVSIAQMAVSVAALLGSVTASLFAPRLLAFAQQPAFDAVSIRPNTSPAGGRGGPRGFDLRYEPGKVFGTVTAKDIVRAAYRLTEYQLSGGPDWFDNDRFDLDAKAATPADENQLRLMLQTMLAERFKLVVRRGTKEMPVYALTVAKSGPTLHELKLGDPFPATMKEMAALTKLRDIQGSLAGAWSDRGTMQYFAEKLSGNPSIDRLVLDKTGLQGVYLFLVRWGTEDNFMAAVEDQFGLKFEPQKTPIDTLVIEHIEKPDPN